MANTRGNRRAHSQQQLRSTPPHRSGSNPVRPGNIPPPSTRQQPGGDQNPHLTDQAGTSQQPHSTVPMADYEALRQQHLEGVQALRDMAGILQSLLPGGILPATIRKFLPDDQHENREISSYREATPEEHSQSPLHRQNYPGHRSPQAGGHVKSPTREKLQETVASTPSGEVRSQTRTRSLRENMRKMMEEMIKEKKLVPVAEEPQRMRSPFTVDIMEKVLPGKFKMPQIPAYAGKEDPNDHIQNYESLMLLHGWEDSIMCRAFPLTLAGHARNWFNNLPENSISSFVQLRAEFLKAFIVNSRRKKDATYLLSIRQGNKETLRQYVDRFRNATLEILNLPVEVAVAAMLQGVKMTSFQESLSLDPPTSLADLFTRANKYILHMEVMKTVGGNHEDKDRKRRDREGDENLDGRRDKTMRRDALQFRHYTRLLEPRSTILAAIEKTGLLQLPKRAERPMGRNQDEYCRYHRARGHSTENCHALKNQIELLIREGHLRRFIRDEEEREPRRREDRGYGHERQDRQRQLESGEDHRQDPPINNEPTLGRILVISGGETMAGDSSSARKAYARLAYQVNSIARSTIKEEPITFTPADQGDIIMPHDDAMVVSAVIAQRHIDRILVDSGSSVNLIYWGCFEQMNIPFDKLKKISSPLFSFSGEAIPVVGSIQLPVTLGTSPKNTTRQANFMVVRTPSTAYNIILGRPLLNDMRAIVSPGYLLMKFPTPKGIGQVRGDQKKARTCYVMSTKGKSPMS